MKFPRIVHRAGGPRRNVTLQAVPSEVTLSCRTCSFWRQRFNLEKSRFLSETTSPPIFYNNVFRRCVYRLSRLFTQTIAISVPIQFCIVATPHRLLDHVVVASLQGIFLRSVYKYARIYNSPHGVSLSTSCRSWQIISSLAVRLRCEAFLWIYCNLSCQGKNKKSVFITCQA